MSIHIPIDICLYSSYELMPIVYYSTTRCYIRCPICGAEVTEETHSNWGPEGPNPTYTFTCTHCGFEVEK